MMRDPTMFESAARASRFHRIRGIVQSEIVWGLWSTEEQQARAIARTLVSKSTGDVMMIVDDRSDADQCPAVRQGAWRPVLFTGQYEE